MRELNALSWEEGTIIVEDWGTRELLERIGVHSYEYWSPSSMGC